MKKAIILGLVAAWSVTGVTQSLPKKSYMRLQGYLNDQVEVMMNLVKINDSLYADYYFSAADFTGNAYNMYYSTPQVAGGTVSEDGSFILRTPFSNKDSEIRGRFVTRQTMAGTWETERGGTKYKFNLSENYPSGSLPLSVWFQVSTRTLVNKGNPPRAYIEQCLIAPGESSDPIVADTIKSRMLALFAAKKPGTTDPQVLLNTLQQSYFSGYISDNLDLYQQMPDGGSFNWDLYKLMHVVYNGQGILSFYIDSYAFTGGAHGLGAQDFTVISLKTGKVVTPADLFVKNFEPLLSSLLTQKLKKTEHIGSGEKLTEKAEYFVDEIPANNNFYITGNGIGFFYNHYEIAPYSHGFTDIFLTFDEIKPLLKPGSPVEALLK